jgi:hypothetical protein
MSEGRFVSFGSPYTFDHGEAYNQRTHRERREREAREARAVEWLASAVVGKTFHSFDALLSAGCQTFATLRDRALTVEEHDLMSRAARALWSGLALRASLVAVKVETVRGNGQVTFRRAA